MNDSTTSPNQADISQHIYEQVGKEIMSEQFEASCIALAHAQSGGNHHKAMSIYAAARIKQLSATEVGYKKFAATQTIAVQATSDSQSEPRVQPTRRSGAAPLAKMEPLKRRRRASRSSKKSPLNVLLVLLDVLFKHTFLATAGAGSSIALVYLLLGKDGAPISIPVLAAAVAALVSFFPVVVYLASRFHFSSLSYRQITNYALAACCALSCVSGFGLMKKGIKQQKVAAVLVAEPAVEYVEHKSGTTDSEPLVLAQNDNFSIK